MRHEASAAFENKHREMLKREHARLMQEHAQLQARHKELVANLQSDAAGEQATWWE